jgi:tyrosyl-tRNA synthetase
MRAFQDAGHIGVLIIGDYTTRIGDPSGRSTERPILSDEEIDRNAQTYVEQAYQIVIPDRTEVRFNSEWLATLSFADVIRLTRIMTVAQMLERDDFSNRYRDQKPIALHEFMYPLMQGYDSVAVEADVELGGTDQLFNLLVGRDLQRAYGQEPQVALTMPLLVGTDGVQKMSQSLGNYIGIREAPDEMFGRVMSVPDALAADYARLAAWWPPERVQETAAAIGGGGPVAGRVKREIARAVVALYRGDEAAAGAEEAFDRQFKQHQIPDDVVEADIPAPAVSGTNVSLPVALAELGLVSSRGEGRRLISQNGVKLDGVTVEHDEVPLESLRGAVLQVGKRRFVRIR